MLDLYIKIGLVFASVPAILLLWPVILVLRLFYSIITHNLTSELKYEAEKAIIDFCKIIPLTILGIIVLFVLWPFFVLTVFIIFLEFLFKGE